MRTGTILKLCREFEASNSNQLLIFMIFAFGYITRRICDFFSFQWMHWCGFANYWLRFHFLLHVSFGDTWAAGVDLQGGGTQVNTDRAAVKKSFNKGRLCTFLCALACSSTYFCTSLISSWSFLTNSMWQLASFSVELLNTSHTGAKVLGRTATHE